MSDADLHATISAPEPLSLALGNGAETEVIRVRVASEVVHLLSDQLYTSATKAIEELVVNAYDADASQCRIALLLDGLGDAGPIPAAARSATDPTHEAASTADTGAPVPQDAQQRSAEGTFPPPSTDALIAVFDDGESMAEEGLRQLWSVGVSPKRHVTETTSRYDRKIIGKFGIGKLATYAIANRITYVVCHKGMIRHVSCDFRDFQGHDGPVGLHVRKVDDLASLLSRPDMALVLDRLGVRSEALTGDGSASWTFCILDELKPKATRIRSAAMRHVLRTAMPLTSNFKVYLDGAEQLSSKLSHEVVVEFQVGALAERRIARINDTFNTSFARVGDALVDPDLFSSGITGCAKVTRRPLEGGKSDFLGRSNGFFVKVRGRVVNLDDPLFHNTSRSHGTFTRFWCELNVDDLHGELMASREAVEEGERRDIASYVAREIFEQARSAYEEMPVAGSGRYTPEDRRTSVEEGLVERPLADVLLTSDGKPRGGDPEGGWIYIEPVASEDKSALVDDLYTKRTPYRYRRSSTGREKPLARFNPSNSEFDINESHQLVLAFDEPQHRELVDIIATAEVMLEIYLAEAGVSPHAISEVLSKRDRLLRSLASERIYSPAAVAEMLREGAESDINLELALVAAARVLGFQVKHIGQKGEPDGLAVLVGSAMEETRITLEAKASAGTPQLGHVDYQTLERHRDEKSAQGVLLLAPRYPAQADDGSAIAKNAKGARVSSWTVEMLAELVEKAARFRITAKQVADIVTTRFSPVEVESAVRDLLSEDRDYRALYVGIMQVLDSMFQDRRSEGDVREVTGIKSVLNFMGHPKATNDQVRRALGDLAAASNGAMELRENDSVLFLSSMEEIRRRVAALTGEVGAPRTHGTFREDPNQPSGPD